ncbi:hypothetical protein V1289_007090 [Bradyrhizobium sp. AZCC 2289]
MTIGRWPLRARKRPDGVVVFNDQFLLTRPDRIAASMSADKLPARLWFSRLRRCRWSSRGDGCSNRSTVLLDPIFAKLLLVSNLGAGPISSESCMLKQVLIVSLFVVTGSIASEARPFRTGQIPECNVTMPCDFSFSRTRGARVSQYTRYDHAAVAEANIPLGQDVGGRPAGCPRSFCGCGAALRVFGRIVPELNLAAKGLRFPRTSPAPGMVAARRGFVLEQHLGGDMWMAYDANSGGHATRVHALSLRGYAVVNPHAA